MSVANLRYEWRRITSIRSTYIMCGVSLLIAVGFGLIYALTVRTAPADAGIPELGTLIIGAGVNNPIILVLLSVVAAQAFGQEYRHGTIRVTLTAFPKRIPVYVSKLIVVLLVLSVTLFAGILLSSAIMIPTLNGTTVGSIEWGSFSAEILRSWLDIVGYCIIVFAITVMTRVLALGVIIPLLFLLAVEVLIVELLKAWVPWLSDVMPFTSGSNFALGDDIARNGLVFLAWVVVMTVIAAVLFKKRDA